MNKKKYSRAEKKRCDQAIISQAIANHTPHTTSETHFFTLAEQTPYKDKVQLAIGGVRSYIKSLNKIFATLGISKITP